MIIILLCASFKITWISVVFIILMLNSYLSKMNLSMVSVLIWTVVFQIQHQIRFLFVKEKIVEFHTRVVHILSKHILCGSIDQSPTYKSILKSCNSVRSCQVFWYSLDLVEVWVVSFGSIYNLTLTSCNY